MIAIGKGGSCRDLIQTNNRSVCENAVTRSRRVDLKKKWVQLKTQKRYITPKVSKCELSTTSSLPAIKFGVKQSRETIST